MPAPGAPLLRVERSHGGDLPTAPVPGTALSAFSSPRRRMWGAGVAHTIEIPAPWIDNVATASRELASIDRTGTLVAFAALPFDGTESARLVIPRTLWTHDSDGERARVDVTVPGDPGPVPDAGEDAIGIPNGSHSAAPAHGGSAELTIRSVVPTAEFRQLVATARERIREGMLTKVVLAREIAVHAEPPIDVADLWNRMTEAHPEALCFAVEGFVGASPELLVSRHAATVRARPMAGTTARTGHADLDQRSAGELLGSVKNRSEHQITIDAVHDALLGWCSYLDAEPSPSVVAAGPVQHLATMVEGRLSRPEPSVLELVAALHPTPAVGGHPTSEALALQAELEPSSRGRYAGPVGWVDSSGNGTFAVGIRSIQLEGNHGSLFAGVGVVADSDPAAELDETRAKAQAVLGTLARI